MCISNVNVQKVLYIMKIAKIHKQYSKPWINKSILIEMNSFTYMLLLKIIYLELVPLFLPVVVHLFNLFHPVASFSNYRSNLENIRL